MEDLKILLSSLNNLGDSELDTLIKMSQEIKEKRVSPVKEPPPMNLDLQSLASYHHDALNEETIKALMTEIKGLKYQPQKENRPAVYLYGDYPYYYTKDTERNLSPTPFSQSLIMSSIVAEVNHKFGTEYNSVLINKYENLHSFLPWHKYDEAMLDTSSPICTLSLGAVRRFQISENSKFKTKPVKDFVLRAKSILVIHPGFQESLFHQLAAGRKSQTNERGIRYSLTFRKVLPPIRLHNPQEAAPFLAEGKLEADNIPEQRPASPASEAKETTSNVNTVVLGSSLVKGLDEGLLSKYGKNFKVFSHPGAHVQDMIEDISGLKVGGIIACEMIETVFLLCGGNDVENLPIDETLDCIFEDFNELFKRAKDTFPNAKINVMSMIPRRVNAFGVEHVHLMHDVNDFLKKSCNELSFRFVDVYSFFILRNGSLNKKLFNGSKIHFSNTGDSVLGKVIIAVTYRPR